MLWALSSCATAAPDALPYEWCGDARTATSTIANARRGLTQRDRGLDAARCARLHPNEEGAERYAEPLLASSGRPLWLERGSTPEGVCQAPE